MNELMNSKLLWKTFRPKKNLLKRHQLPVHVSPSPGKQPARGCAPSLPEAEQPVGKGLSVSVGTACFAEASLGAKACVGGRAQLVPSLQQQEAGQEEPLGAPCSAQPGRSSRSESDFL